ncbi:MAG: hypothetical protein JXN63_04645 [Candidatus Delongbacteria bacterium]|nr:hypothetical protein [Candidatus Delongbacteria bacterium]
MKHFLLFMIISASYLNAITFKEGNKIFPYYLWFGAGAGVMRNDTSGFLSLNATVNFSKGHHIIKIRGIGSLADNSTAFGEDSGDIGLLYGYRHSFGNISISYMAGTAITAGTYKGDKYFVENDPAPRYEMIDYKTFGFPIEVQIDMNALRLLGLSFSLFADLNTEKSFIGFSTNILIGRLP